MVDYPVDSNGGGGAEQACGSNALLSDAIFVSRDELEGFFTRTFSDRILLMLESKTPVVSTNEPDSINPTHHSKLAKSSTSKKVTAKIHKE